LPAKLLNFLICGGGTNASELEGNDPTSHKAVPNLVDLSPFAFLSEGWVRRREIGSRGNEEPVCMKKMKAGNINIVAAARRCIVYQSCQGDPQHAPRHTGILAAFAVAMREVNWEEAHAASLQAASAGSGQNRRGRPALASGLLPSLCSRVRSKCMHSHRPASYKLGFIMTKVIT
jgi:hypothetical protein